jgi:hypothetical protein
VRIWVGEEHFLSVLKICIFRSCPVASACRHSAGQRLLRPHGKCARHVFWTVWPRSATCSQSGLDSSCFSIPCLLW